MFLKTQQDQNYPFKHKNLEENQIRTIFGNKLVNPICVTPTTKKKIEKEPKSIKSRFVQSRRMELLQYL